MVSLQTGFSIGGPLSCVLPEAILKSSFVPKIQDFEPGSDAYWMVQAINESLRSIGISNPNPGIGCVLVDAQGREISRGFTQSFRQKHAERIAFEKITDPSRLDGATAYVTLEPCSHTGNQPPCVDLLLNSEIKRVVISRLDPDPRVAGQGLQKLKDAGKEITLGVLATETTAWNFSFLANLILKRPVIVLKWAQTLDGQLSDDSNRSQWISGPASRAYTHWLRQKYDVILVGALTALSDSPRLTIRDCKEPHQSSPLPIILDLKGRCFGADDVTQKKLSLSTFNPDRKVVLVTQETVSRDQSGSWLHQLDHVVILTVPGLKPAEECVSLFQQDEITELLGHPCQSVMIEGGAKTLNMFLKAGYADLMHTFIAPVLTGGRKNRIHLELLLNNPVRLETLTSFRLGDDTVFEMTTQDLAQRIFSFKDPM